jgi:hypothetical protein
MYPGSLVVEQMPYQGTLRTGQGLERGCRVHHYHDIIWKVARQE